MLDASGSVDFCNERRLSPAKKILYRRPAVHEVIRKVRKRNLAHDDEQRDAVLHDGAEFIRLVTDAPVMGERDPAPFPDLLQPRLVRRVVREVIGVPLDRQAAGFQNFRESFSEIAIGEIDKAQAARS